MNRNTIRLVVILATASILGITITQFYWMKRVFDIKEREFNLSVNNALKMVSERLCDCEEENLPSRNPVDQISSTYFVVSVNENIDPAYLDYYLRDELSKRNVKVDFEYGIYDCRVENMVYTKYVKQDGEAEDKIPEIPALTDAPFKRDQSYFGVHFPGKTSNLISQMGIWIFSSFVLLLVIVFFGYTLFVILKQKRLSEIQKDFINNMTHEFKTPISTISISSEVLKDPEIIKSPERLLNYASIIQNESHRLKGQVERVLQMASLEENHFGLKKEELNIHEIIKYAIDSIKLSLEEKKGAIQYGLDAEKATLKADKLHLTNIIYNLLDNAVKYSKRIPNIRLITRNERQGIVIGIEDNGIGIESSLQKKIFNKFFRVPTGNVHDVKGFGLGLNYVNMVAKAHNGEITVESKPGVGSRFSIYLPFS